LGVVEFGTGGGFTSLFAGDADSAHVVAGALIVPVQFDLGEAASGKALELARQAATPDGSLVGFALVFEGARQPLGLVAGTVHLAISQPGSEPRLLNSLTVRATLPEVQRRSGLHAADMLRQVLTA
jgi:hypothetical protein